MGFNGVKNRVSINAQTVAHKVLDKVRKGEQIKLVEILRSSGYSKGISEQPSRVTRQKSYTDIIKPMLPQLEAERQRLMKAMGEKNLSKEKYSTLVSGYDVLTKNYQLLSGKATENVAMVIEVSEAVAKKNTAKTAQNTDSVK